ncbi:MAG: hypothetical protein OWS03_08590 [Alicyclobacillaceae bacterium]|jgi:uncharacterized membrane protein|uniref:hypothetical protein n=1 Tax=Alicyclobacillus sp. SP_1 TaxID=2942475 RepID=UPI0021581A2F|nr:hypothetical protein [Alicyclobacillus sp. SP_1]MCY0896327.1 hypothetical protein [Alicyclobacillaceae bacterium]
MNVFYYLVWIAIAIVALVVLSVFLTFAIKLAILLALLAFAFYWLKRALGWKSRTAHRKWR